MLGLFTAVCMISSKFNVSLVDIEIKMFWISERERMREGERGKREEREEADRKREGERFRRVERGRRER